MADRDAEQLRLNYTPDTHGMMESFQKIKNILEFNFHYIKNIDYAAACEINNNRVEAEIYIKLSIEEIHDAIINVRLVNITFLYNNLLFLDDKITALIKTLTNVKLNKTKYPWTDWDYIDLFKKNLHLIKDYTGFMANYFQEAFNPRKFYGSSSRAALKKFWPLLTFLLSTNIISFLFGEWASKHAPVVGHAWATLKHIFGG